MGRGAKELVYRNDKLAEERAYDAEGALLEENFYDTTHCRFKRASTSSRGRPALAGRIRRCRRRERGNPVLPLRPLRPASSASIRTAISERVPSGMISVGAIPQASWVSGTPHSSLGYDDAGRAAVVQVMKDGEAVSVEQRSSRRKRMLASVQTEDKASGLAPSLPMIRMAASRADGNSAKGPAGPDRVSLRRVGALVEETQRRGGHRTARSLAYPEADR